MFSTFVNESFYILYDIDGSNNLVLGDVWIRENELGLENRVIFSPQSTV